ncbi:hypothetical protein PR048_025344 [Dryococelus australis]|uniref:Uncharacterized protein n=1 Tax=Dryococelus australis TaxID=614101 RepID=A0ABQ9GR64_9NEOP|nr:hypothetical protein PR048_025344 [Dryococelus australis]
MRQASEILKLLGANQYRGWMILTRTRLRCLPANHRQTYSIGVTQFRLVSRVRIMSSHGDTPPIRKIILKARTTWGVRFGALMKFLTRSGGWAITVAIPISLPQRMLISCGGLGCACQRLLRHLSLAQLVVLLLERVVLTCTHDLMGPGTFQMFFFQHILCWDVNRYLHERPVLKRFRCIHSPDVIAHPRRRIHFQFNLDWGSPTPGSLEITREIQEAGVFVASNSFTTTESRTRPTSSPGLLDGVGSESSPRHTLAEVDLLRTTAGLKTKRKPAKLHRTPMRQSYGRDSSFEVDRPPRGNCWVREVDTTNSTQEIILNSRCKDFGEQFIEGCERVQGQIKAHAKHIGALTTLVKLSLHEAEEYPESRTLAELQKRPMMVSEVSMERRRNERAGKRKIPEKTHRSTASSGTIPTCGNPVTRPGIEPGPPWWEASRLTAQPLRLQNKVLARTFDPPALNSSRVYSFVTVRDICVQLISCYVRRISGSQLTLKILKGPDNIFAGWSAMCPNRSGQKFVVAVVRRPPSSGRPAGIINCGCLGEVLACRFCIPTLLPPPYKAVRERPPAGPPLCVPWLIALINKGFVYKQWRKEVKRTPTAFGVRDATPLPTPARAPGIPPSLHVQVVYTVTHLGSKHWAPGIQLTQYRCYCGSWTNRNAPEMQAISHQTQFCWCVQPGVCGISGYCNSVYFNTLCLRSIDGDVPAALWACRGGKKKKKKATTKQEVSEHRAALSPPGIKYERIKACKCRYAGRIGGGGGEGGGNKRKEKFVLAAGWSLQYSEHASSDPLAGAWSQTTVRSLEAVGSPAAGDLPSFEIRFFGFLFREFQRLLPALKALISWYRLFTIK